MAAEPVSPLVAPTTVRWYRSAVLVSRPLHDQLLRPLAPMVSAVLTSLRLVSILTNQEVLEQVP